MGVRWQWIFEANFGDCVPKPLQLELTQAGWLLVHGACGKPVLSVNSVTTLPLNYEILYSLCRMLLINVSTEMLAQKDSAFGIPEIRFQPRTRSRKASKPDVGFIDARTA